MIQFTEQCKIKSKLLMRIAPSANEEILRDLYLKSLLSVCEILRDFFSK